jgi:glycosyltransferase involved in cell wall biosynthesis
VKLSIIIPVFNEEETIAELLRKVDAVDLEKQVIVVDDGSQDGTREILAGMNNDGLTVVYHQQNQGKGAAVRTGLQKADGDVVVIQDADLEYDPYDFHAMMELVTGQGAQVVYGSRLLKKDNPQGGFSFYWGGRLVTLATNLIYGSKLTDEPTCYKMFRSNVLEGMDIESNGFEWEPEVTAKILKKGIRIDEVPISYRPRKVEQGKKIKALDGLKAIWALLKYRFRGNAN